MPTASTAPAAWRYRHGSYEDYQQLKQHLHHQLLREKDGLHTLVEPPHDNYNHLELTKHQAAWKSMKTLEGDKVVLVHDVSGISALTNDLKTSWQDRSYSVLYDMIDNTNLQTTLYKKVQKSNEKFKVAMLHIADKWKHHSKEVRQDMAIGAMEDLRRSPGI